MRTDNGTFTFKVPASLGGAWITMRHERGIGSITFYVDPRGSEGASLQISGLLLEVEVDQGHEVIEKLYQAVREGDPKKKWARDARCTRCEQKRDRFSPLCRACARDGVSA